MSTLEDLSKLACEQALAPTNSSKDSTEVDISSSSSPNLSIRQCRPDWSRQISVEERQYVRGKIKASYAKRSPTYEELLETCAAIEEEFVFMVAPSRLDYFKSGVQYEKRISEKIAQLKNGFLEPHHGHSSDQIKDEPRTIKRTKTNH